MNKNWEGSWIPAPNQQGDCGYGNYSLLSRRVLKKTTRFLTTPLQETANQRKKPATNFC